MKINVLRTYEMPYLGKILVLAERAWASQPAWAKVENDNLRKGEKAKAWNQFCNTVGHYDLARLDYMNGGYGYRIPPPGVKVMDGKVHANTLFPGLNIKFSENKTELSSSSDCYTNSITNSEKINFKIYTKNGRGSRSVSYK